MDRTGVKLDGIWGGDASYPGKPSCTGIKGCWRYYKTEPTRRTRSGEGAEGGRFTDSTDDLGPMKPGNRVEDKTLAIGKEQTEWSFMAENPPLATVNTHLFPKFIFICNKPGRSDSAIRSWEVVDERR